ncbi:MAG: DUF4349 domain-containing protein [Sphingomonadales bacterium]|nr:DUF4349 domain-containing protein [Sphingomonadales bacterium]MBD3772798.1 DUF4349 domain-containing protein [Paracoccaceae bacterium]
MRRENAKANSKAWNIPIMAALAPLILLGACTQQEGGRSADEASEAVASTDVAMADGAAAPDSARDTPRSASDSALPQLDPVPVNQPKLAYEYSYSYRLPAADIGKLQRRHADLCEQQGPASCQILGMTKSGEDADYVTGELQLAVATKQARAFGALLEDEAEDSGADQLSAEIASEEPSKNIVDTEAHLRSRVELRDRLMEVLRTRKGKVSELIEAERSVAQVNQEIDEARSWLREMQGRVAYSRVTVRYESGVAPAHDFMDPVRGALGSVGSILGVMFAALIMIATVGGPVALAVWGVTRWNRRRRPTAEPSA